MSLYGALFTGVSGLNAQGQKIAIISDNIANVNTVGYKEAKASFESLVVNAATTTAYSPGGVRSNTVQNISKQGIVSSTSAPTDIALSGSGFFTVSARADGSGETLYTRAGSFRQDRLGNFVNANGFYLKGWPLDREGRLPGELGNLNSISSANLESLEVVNVESGAGVALATSQVQVGINLDAGQTIYPGPKGTVDMDQNTVNFGIGADDIIVPDEGYTPFVAGVPSFGLASANNIVRGDRLSVTTGSGLAYDYTYGGFTIGRRIDIATNTNIGDQTSYLGPVNVGANITTIASSNNVDVDLSAIFGLPPATTISTLGLNVGDTIRLTGVGVNAATTAPTSQFNGVVTLTAVNALTGVVQFQTATPEDATAGASTTGTVRVDGFVGNILDATSTAQAFLGTTGVTGYTTAARSFTITTPSSGSHTFTYTTSSPNAATGQFNNLTNLAEAIDQASGLTSRVVNGRLVVGAEDANESVTFANVDATGTSPLAGINWISELGLANVTSGTRRFNSQNSLAAQVQTDPGVSAVVTNPLSESTLTISADDPLDTIRFQDYAGTVTTLSTDPVNVTGVAAGVATVTIDIVGHSFAVGNNIILNNLAATSGVTGAELTGTFRVSATTANTVTIQVTTAAGVVGGPGGGLTATYQATNIGSITSELGLTTSLLGGAYVRGDTGNLGPEYDASGSVGANLASGDIVAQFSRTQRIYDALGTGHDIRFSYIKTANNEWALEVHAVNPDEVNTTLVDGQLAVGTIQFNGDGTLRNVSTSLTRPITINWTNGAVASVINFDYGTAGQPLGTTGGVQLGDTNGLSQFDSSYNVKFLNQNGAPVGELVSVNIDENGFVVASYSNGETQNLYKLPVADFNNPDGLNPESGNAYTQTRDSGDVNLREAGTSGTGTIAASALEQSNVDLSEQLTDLIVAQRSYQANTRVISTTDDLLEQLNQI
ncbi:MAG: flagellar hook-basal body complex protein [Rickettsiales bacterium]|nr:flagellar hook-basal body complex protein [Rickettsiales bacterium]